MMRRTSRLLFNASHQLLRQRIALSSPLERPSHYFEFVANGGANKGEKRTRLLKLLKDRLWLRSVKLFQLEPLFLNKAICSQLPLLPHFEELYLSANAEASKLDFPPLHSYFNLKSLSLHGIPPTDRTYVTGLPECLRMLLGLRHLGLSAGSAGPRAHNKAQDRLYQLVSYFRLQNVPPLFLQSLHLGRGFLPLPGAKRKRPTGSFLPPENYLEKMIEPGYLQALRLDNAQILTPNPEDPTKMVCDVGFNPLPASEFRSATNLKSLTVERLGPDIVDLIRHIKDAQGSSPQLDTLRVLRYSSTVFSRHSEIRPQGYSNSRRVGKPIYSVPLHEVGYDWRRLCYSGFPVSFQTFECLEMALDILRYVSRCTKLEELAIPIHRREELDMFKNVVLPRLPHLQVLHLPWSSLSDFMGTDKNERNEVVVEEPQSQAPSAQENGDASSSRDAPCAPPPTKETLSVVQELFDWHAHLRERKPHMARLKYIAVDEHAYTRSEIQNQPGSVVDGEQYTLSDGSTIVKVERDRARKVGIIEILGEQRLSGTNGRSPV
ncbi:hypothetical protein BJX64DRAFT_272346 [Aspergillus heterothallicus]